MAEGTQGAVTVARTLAVWMRDVLEELELSPHTIRLYMGEVTMALSWAETEGLDLITVGADDFKRHVATRPNTHPTRRALRSGMRQFWLASGRVDPPLWTIRVPKKRRMVCRAVDDPEAALYAERALTVGGKQGAATVLALFNGFRREEISTLRPDRVDNDGWITFIGKGNVEDEMPLHPYSRVLLDSLPPSTSGFYFPGRVEGHVHPATIWNWVTAVTGQPTHVLRHTAIAKGNDGTGDLRATQGFARHVTPDTTAGYTRATRRNILKVMNAIDYGLAS